MQPIEFYIWVDGICERNELIIDQTRSIMWAVFQKGNRRKIKKTDFGKLRMDDVRQIANEFSDEEYLIKKEQIERWHKRNKTS